MISQYSAPKDIDSEFWQDFDKATYWLNKKISGKTQQAKIMDDGWEVFNYRQEYSLSEPFYYDSPTTGNHWMMWVTSKRDDHGELHMYCRLAIYLYTEVYMTMMLPMVFVDKDRDGNVYREMRGVNVYTAHMFQRMADKDRLGVDMSDRVKVMRNFAEFIATGWSDTRPPRKGERHTQIMLRTPGSWLRGHTVMVKDRHVTIYRTFWTDKSMNPKQLRDVRSFSRFADSVK